MSEERTAARARRSVSMRFNLALLAMYVISVLLSVPAVYYFAGQQVEEQANRELQILVDMVQSIQGYVASDLRPHFTSQGVFYSPAVSGIVAVSRVAQNFKERQPDFYIKVASDNPLNGDNWPEPLEQVLLERYRQDRSLEGLRETGTIQGRSYLVSSVPKHSRKGCLRCHGDPKKAPPDVRDTYGTTSGYYYEPEGVVGVSLVGAPLANVQQLTLERSLFVVGMLTVLFGLIFVTVNLLVRRYMIRPIVAIADNARAVSQGDLDRQVGIERDDEIGELAHSFELMRRSLLSAMKRMRQ